MAKTRKSSTVLSDVELAAMKETLRERKLGASQAEWEAEALAKIAELPKAEREMAERLYALIRESAPSLTPKTWYGMPAFAKDGKNFCYFQSASKFKSRYATFGFSDVAKVDDGEFWPVAYALKELTPAVEKKIAALVKKGAG